MTSYKKVASHEALNNTFDKVLLLYSGGLDTSVMLKWIQDKYHADVYALCVDIGQDDDFEPIKEKALKLGAKKVEVVDAVDKFATVVCSQAIKANVDYEDGYRLFCPLGRIIISAIAVEYAEKWGCTVIAHGATGKGNDQIRFESYITTLNPELKILAPVREWGMGRDEELAYAEEHGIPVPTANKLYSYDENLWGSSAEGGEIEDFAATPNLRNILKNVTPPEDVQQMFPAYVEISFTNGIPTSMATEDGAAKGGSLRHIIDYANTIGSKYGLGITHLIENRVIGLKIRGIYEEPGAELLITAHKALEKIVSTREEYNFKKTIDHEWAQLIYDGKYYHPLVSHLNSYIESTQRKVTGHVKLRIFKGVVEAVAYKSPFSLNNEQDATFMKDNSFNQNASAGFIEHFNYTQKLAYNIEKDIYEKTVAKEPGVPTTSED